MHLPPSSPPPSPPSNDGFTEVRKKNRKSRYNLNTPPRTPERKAFLPPQSDTPENLKSRIQNYIKNSPPHKLQPHSRTTTKSSKQSYGSVFGNPDTHSPGPKNCWASPPQLPPSPYGVDSLPSPPQNKLSSRFNSLNYGASTIDQSLLSQIRPELHTPNLATQPLSKAPSLTPRTTKIIMPISPLMTGDVSHFISYSFVNPDCKFLLLYPNNDPEQTANLNRIREELSFFIPADRFQFDYVDNPHQHFKSLIDQKPYFRPGFATKNIADNARLIQSRFAEKLDLVYAQHFEIINNFLYNTLSINPDPSVPKLVIWGRNSGDLKGAHPESDTSTDFFNLTHQFIHNYFQENNSPFQLIFIGDTPKSSASKPLSRSNVVNMFEFWKLPEFQGLIEQTQLPSNVLQLLLFYTLSKEGHSCRHISQRSGILDRLSFALPPNKNKFIVLMPKGFDRTRISHLTDFFSIEEINSPLTPKGRLLQMLHARINDLEHRYGVDGSRVRSTLNSTFNLSYIEQELKKLSHINPQLKRSQDKYILSDFQPMLQGLNNPNPDAPLERPLTTKSIEKLETILKTALKNSPYRHSRR